MGTKIIRHHAPILLLAVVLTSVGGVSLNAQNLRVGVVAGAPITVDYPAFTTPGFTIALPDGGTATFPPQSYRSQSRTLIGGPSLGWQFNDRFAVEGSAIYRRLRIELFGPTVTWQFPIMAKYRFANSPVAPFLEAGPTFRTTGNRNTEPSHTGMSAGAGLDLQWGVVRISPTLRYTRWARDRETMRGNPPSKQDQVEVLVYLSSAPTTNYRPLGKRYSVGFIAGGMLNSPAQPVDNVFGTEQGDLPFSISTTSRPYIVGPHFEILLSERWGLTAAATYRPMRVNQTFEGSIPGPGGNPLEAPRRQERFTMAAIWQFPVLAKFRFSGDRARPFFEAGPSFRLPQDFNGNLSRFGFTTGMGVDVRIKGVHLEPGLRFSHFGPARTSDGRVLPNITSRNQLDAVCVFRF